MFSSIDVHAPSASVMRINYVRLQIQKLMRWNLLSDYIAYLSWKCNQGIKFDHMCPKEPKNAYHWPPYSKLTTLAIALPLCCFNFPTYKALGMENSLKFTKWSIFLSMWFRVYSLSSKVKKHNPTHVGKKIVELM